MANTIAAMLAAAASRYGYREGAGNNTEFGRWYGLNGQPWCDMFVSWCADQSGNLDVVGRFAYCPSHVNWFKQKSRWHGWQEAPQVGDIVFYNWAGTHGNADHVGIVIALTGNSGAPVVAREGNSSTANTSEGVAVWDHTRSRQWIVGFGRPAYSNVPSGGGGGGGTADWDGHTFPGVSAFALGSWHPAVTVLGQRLVYWGFGGAYQEGPGVPMGPADVANTKAYQLAQGWTGADADGYPGPETWRRLMLNKTPTNTTPPPPQDTRPWVSLSRVLDSSYRDGPAPQGWAAHREDALLVERALAKLGYNPGPVDGSFGTLAVKAYKAWQLALGYRGADADGHPGLTSLQKLGDRTGLFRVSG